MSEISKKDYITVNAKGIFVDDKPATEYRGERIDNIDYIKRSFSLMQRQNPSIEEFHVMSSVTPGEHSMFGIPSPKHGQNAWCRIVYRTGKVGGWMFDVADISKKDCAIDCATQCIAYASFRARLSQIQKTNQHKR